jgi:hypothetical protein
MAQPVGYPTYKGRLKKHARLGIAQPSLSLRPNAIHHVAIAAAGLSDILSRKVEKSRPLSNKRPSMAKTLELLVSTFGKDIGALIDLYFFEEITDFHTRGHYHVCPPIGMRASISYKAGIAGHYELCRSPITDIRNVLAGAAYKGHMEIIDMMVKLKLTHNELNYARAAACFYKQSNIMTMLIKAGATECDCDQSLSHCEIYVPMYN